MPSIRKRIGYLPSMNAQKSITNIAKKEKLSQSKVVGILVEEALLARAGMDLHNINDVISKNLLSMENNTDNSTIRFSDVDELISDKGITYNTKKYKYKSELSLHDSIEDFNEELFEQFKQFLLFQKMIQDK